VFGESYPSEKERNEAIEGYANYLEEIGGFHRVVVADMQSSDFELFNEALPTVWHFVKCDSIPEIVVDPYINITVHLEY